MPEGTTVYGRFCFFDVVTTDVEAAKVFYTVLFGWEAERWERGSTPRLMLRGEAGPLGGVLPLDEVPLSMRSTPHWRGYVLAEDADRTAERALRLGGDVLVPPTVLPDAGRFAVLRDPQGAVIGVYAPDRDPPETREPRVGELSWSELATTNHPAALNFYRAIFGWTETELQDLGAELGGAYQLFGCQGRSIGGMFTRPAHAPGPPLWLHYVRVADLDDSTARAVELGATLLAGPLDVPGGDRVAQLRDPQGAPFALHAVGDS